MLMIDDFTNGWVDYLGNDDPSEGADWGMWMDHPGSSFTYLSEVLLKDAPNIKTTFFVPLNRNPQTKTSKYRYHYGPIDESDEIKDFFLSVQKNDKFELASHGISHGQEIDGQFVQEWLLFKDQNEALSNSIQGREYFRNIFGQYPEGGKYPGYRSNDFSDPSIDGSGYLWWCRSDSQSDLGYFGQSPVVDIPTSICGDIFRFSETSALRKFAGRILGRKPIQRAEFLDMQERQIRSIIEGGKLLSIQEHIAPSRTDGKRQRPNIFDDRESLYRIFGILREYDCWYATGTEVASYFNIRNQTQIIPDGKLSFHLKYTGRSLRNMTITITIEEFFENFRLRGPAGLIAKTLTPENGRTSVTFEMQNGLYELVPESENA